MQIRINWTEIYFYFISSETISLRDCAEKFHVNYDSLRQKASDLKWTKEKKKSQQEVRHMVEIQINKSTAVINKEHVQLGQTLQKRAIKAMIEKNILPTNARDVRAWMSTGQRMERNALGMNQSTQQNQLQEQHPNENLLEEGTKSNDE